MSIETVVLSSVLSLVCAGLVGSVKMILKLQSRMDITETELKGTISVVDHLTRTGESLKNELGSLKTDITEVKGDIKTINTNLEFIKEAIQDLKK